MEEINVLYNSSSSDNRVKPSCGEVWISPCVARRHPQNENVTFQKVMLVSSIKVKIRQVFFEFHVKTRSGAFWLICLVCFLSLFAALSLIHPHL